MSTENETPYALAKRLHAQGTASPEVERALRERGLDEEEARIAARAGRGEAGSSPLGDSAPDPAVRSELPDAPPSEAPQHPCPTHAAWPVVATCSRCGKFLCSRCLRDGGFFRLPESGQCPACETLAPKSQGIGGWLVLPALHLTVVAPLSAVVGIGQDAMALPQLPPELLAPVVVEMLFNTSFLAYAIFTAVFFFRKKQRAVVMMVGFYVAVMISAVLAIVLAGWIEGITGHKLPDEEGPVQTGRSFISGVIWIAYFLQSKRVKATFVVP